MRNLLTTLLLSTGVPMLMAGDEMGRTQRGNNNAYCQDNETSWVDWDLQPWQRELLDWARALLAVRRAHAVFRHKHFFEGRPAYPGGPKDLAWFGPTAPSSPTRTGSAPTCRTVGMSLSGDGSRARTRTGQRRHDDTFLLVLHGGAGDDPVRASGRAVGPDLERGAGHRATTGRWTRRPRQLAAGASLDLSPRCAVLLRASPVAGTCRRSGGRHQSAQVALGHRTGCVRQRDEVHLGRGRQVRLARAAPGPCSRTSRPGRAAAVPS